MVISASRNFSTATLSVAQAIVSRDANSDCDILYVWRENEASKIAIYSVFIAIEIKAITVQYNNHMTF